MVLKGVFVDIKESDWNLDPKEVEKKITSRTKAIIAVHWNGHPCDLESLKDLVQDKDIALIEDAAPSLGAEYHGKKVGSIGDIGCLAFKEQR